MNPILKKLLSQNSLRRVFVSFRNVFTKTLTDGDRSITVHMRNMLERDIPQIKELRRRNKFYDPVSLYSLCLELDPTCVVVAEDGEGKVIGVISGFKGIENMIVGGMRTAHEDYRKLGLMSKVVFPWGQQFIGNRLVVAVTVFGELQFNQNRLPYLTKNFVVVDFESKQDIDPERLSSHIPPGVEIKELDDFHMVNVLEYDHLVSGYRREALIQFNHRDPYSKTVTAQRDSKCVGYGTIKLDIQGGKKVGPLYADSPEIAEAVLKKLLEYFNSAKGFHASALSNNAFALKMFEQLGEMRTFINYRLCSKDITWPEYRNVYAVFEVEILPI